MTHHTLGPMSPARTDLLPAERANLMLLTTKQLLEEVERRLVLRCEAEAGQRKVDFQWAYSHVQEAMILIRE